MRQPTWDEMRAVVKAGERLASDYPELAELSREDMQKELDAARHEWQCAVENARIWARLHPGEKPLDTWA